MKPIFFADAGRFRAWLAAHGATAQELWVGYHKKGSGLGGMVYREALDEALCFGWIDGRVQSIDAERYMQRFTPRRARSYWSAVNVRKAEALVAAGRMAPAGLAAFRARPAAPPRRYSGENPAAALDASMVRTFKAEREAWAWFQRQAPSFRKVAAHWVTSAKRPETRTARLADLIACAARGERPKPFQVARRQPGVGPGREIG
jgi:uncharacterized protein YdeI (YjbR/CyaY-like superfamily)